MAEYPSTTVGYCSRKSLIIAGRFTESPSCSAIINMKRACCRSCGSAGAMPICRRAGSLRAKPVVVRLLAKRASVACMSVEAVEGLSIPIISPAALTNGHDVDPSGACMAKM